MRLRDGIKNWLQITEQLSKRGNGDTYISIVGFEEEREAAGSLGAFSFSVQFQSSGVDLCMFMNLLLVFVVTHAEKLNVYFWKILKYSTLTYTKDVLKI